MRKDISVTHYLAGADPLEGPLRAAADWFTDTLAAIPEPCRESARVEFYNGECGVRVWVRYDRPETDQEMAARETLAANRKIAKESWEREQLRRLQAKYEDTP